MIESVRYVQSVRYNVVGGITIAGCTFDVPAAEADKALAALRSTPPREIEIVEGEDGTWKTRTVRLMPRVVIKARGKIHTIYPGHDGEPGSVVVMTSPTERHAVLGQDAMRACAAILADGWKEVEIVSVDGGPVTVRRVS